MNRISKYLFFLLPVLLFAACQDRQTEDSEDTLLAKAYNKTLYLSELDGMFSENASAEDSAHIISTFVQRWVRDMVLLREAERNIPGDLNIDKLVRDYRASLIRHNYEKILVEQLLDSTITQTKLTAFYEQNKGQYQLETPIVRCYFIKLPLPIKEPNKIRQLWNSGPQKLKELTDYCNKNAESFLLEDSTWNKVENIAVLLPHSSLTVDNVSNKRDFIQRDNEYQYYFKVFELKKRKDIAPLSYIENQARKVILRNRKNELLEDFMEDLYQVEIQKNNIEIYTD